MLTKNEKLLIADALNGCNMLIACDPNYMRQMVGPKGAVIDAAIIGKDKDGRVILTGSRIASGLEHEVYDSIRLNSLDTKWDVDGAELVSKIRTMTSAQRETLIRKVGEVWQRNDEHFERDLEALAL